MPKNDSNAIFFVLFGHLWLEKFQLAKNENWSEKLDIFGDFQTLFFFLVR